MDIVYLWKLQPARVTKCHRNTHAKKWQVGVNSFQFKVLKLLQLLFPFVWVILSLKDLLCIRIDILQLWNERQGLSEGSAESSLCRNQCVSHVSYCTVTYRIGSYCVYASTASDADKVHCPVTPHPNPRILTHSQHLILIMLESVWKRCQTNEGTSSASRTSSASLIQRFSYLMHLFLATHIGDNKTSLFLSTQGLCHIHWTGSTHLSMAHIWGWSWHTLEYLTQFRYNSAIVH